MSRSGQQPAEQAVEVRSRAEVMGRGALLGDHQRDHAVRRDDVGHQSPSGAEAGLELGQRHRVGERAGAALLPGLLAHALPELRLPAALSRDGFLARGQRRSSARSAATCSSRGTRTGCTRLASIRARSDHSKSTSGDPDALAIRSPRTASRRPCPATMVCRSRLPNELCHACRSSSPRRRCPRRRGGPAGTLRQRGPHVAVAEPYAERRARRDPNGSEPAPCVVELAAPEDDERRVEPDVARPPPQVECGQLGLRARRRAAPATVGSGLAAPRRRASPPRPERVGRACG